MYRYIKGTVQETGAGYLVVENGGIGYMLSVSHNTICLVEPGREIKIYTRLIVREDDMFLCGFISEDEMEMFDMLIGVSSIGPKSAINMLSFPESSSMADYIMGGDVKSLSKFPGIGKKTAERIILELKDKLKKKGMTGMGMALHSEVEPDSKKEALQALVSLGYSQAEAAEAVESVFGKANDTQAIVKLSLKYLMR